jgi:hypothetical protein
MDAFSFGVGVVRTTAARFRCRRPSAMTPRVGLNHARKGAGPRFHSLSFPAFYLSISQTLFRKRGIIST